MIKIYSAPAGTDILESHQMSHKEQTEVYTMQFKYVPSKHCLLFCGSIILLLPLNKQIAIQCIQRHLFIFALSFFLWSLFLSLLDYAFTHIYKQDYRCKLKMGSLWKNNEKRALKGVATPSVKHQRQWQRPIQINGDFSQASTQVSSGVSEVCRLPLGVFMPLRFMYSEGKRIFFFYLYRCTIWTLNLSLCEPIKKWCRLCFRTHIDGPLGDLKCTKFHKLKCKSDSYTTVWTDTKEFTLRITTWIKFPLIWP